MSLSRKWEATAINGIAGFEIIVRGEVNTSMLDVMPQLEKRIPQGINPTILQLNLLNAFDVPEENFKPVQYNEKLEKQNTFLTVEIFFEDEVTESVVVNSK